MRQRLGECGSAAGCNVRVMGHVRLPSPFFSCDSSSLDSASTTKVMKNSTRPEVDQRGLVQAFAGLGELVGQRRRDAVGGLEQRQRVELVEVADDEGHRHRLAERAAQAEHDAADDAGLGVGQHDLPDHLPGGRAEPVGRLLEHRRRDLEHVAHHRGDERDDHDRQDDAGRQDADAHRRPRHQRTEHRHAAEQAPAAAAAHRSARIGPNTSRPHMP